MIMCWFARRKTERVTRELRTNIVIAVRPIDITRGGGEQDRENTIEKTKTDKNDKRLRTYTMV